VLSLSTGTLPLLTPCSWNLLRENVSY